MLIYIVIILLFASLVILHELGHFWMARRNGVIVEEFGIGFPPKVWGKIVKGTLYSVNALPLGGFVRLKGEDGEVGGKGTFGAASVSAKTKILLAGVGMNLVTAVVLLYGLAVTGMPGLGQFEPKFLSPSYAQPKQLRVVEVTKDSPADRAGIKVEDRLLKANDNKLETDDQLFAFTKSHAGQEVQLTLRTGNQPERTVNVQLRGPEEKQGFLGVGSQQFYMLRYDPLSAVVAAIWTTGALFVATVVGLVQFFASIPMLIVGLFLPVISATDVQASGPVGILYYFQSASTLGVAYVAIFLANIAVALAVFNVLPLPALDGGRLALIWWQHLTGRKISPDLEAKIHGYGFMALLGLMVLVSIYDLRKQLF